MKFTRLAIILTLAAIPLLGCSNSMTNEIEKVSITVSAAASLNGALSEIEQQFENEHGHIDLLLNFGGSGSLQQQIKQGAPVDLFFSAAEEPFQDLLANQFIDEKYYSNLIKNRLVLITPKDKDVDSLQALTEEDVQKISIGTPESVPAGHYAKQALHAARLWDPIQEKLVLAKDVRQVLTYVETGNVDAGFVYYSDIVSTDKVKVIEELDEQSHDPIVYPAGVIESSKHKDEAVLFYQYLTTEASEEIFKKYGFHTLE